MKSRIDRFLLAGALASALALGDGGAAMARKHGLPPAPMQPDAPAASAASGPGADFPVVIGAPYAIGAVTYTPSNVMNIDAVGYASVGAQGGSAVSAGHHTLPLPSYAEVTSLDSGRTILVRVDRRGPMDSNDLIELSPGAAAQLGLSGGRAAVRVRRVNPPEAERAELRSGQPAPERIVTPKPLLAVLTRRLTPDGAVSLNTPMSHAAMAGSAPGAMAPAAMDMAPTPNMSPAMRVPAPRPHFARAMVAPTPTAMAPVSTYPAPPSPAYSASAYAAPPSPHVHSAARAPASHMAAPRPEMDATAEPAPVSAGSLVVQVGAFAVKGNAAALAAKLDGNVSAAAHLWRVRMGPYASHAEAEAALAKARAAGFAQARIQRLD